MSRRALPGLLVLLLSCGRVASLPDGGADGDVVDSDASHDGDEPESSVVWCAAQWPYETSTSVGMPTELLFVRARVDGVTPTDGGDARITVELGYGPADSPPWEAGWVWSRTEHNPSCDGCPEDQDEQMGAVSPSREGDLLWAGRVRFDGGEWTYCDRGDDGRAGSDDGWSVEDAPRLRVEPAALLAVVSLNLRCLLDDWDLRLPLIAQALAAADPVFAGFQEVCRETGVGGRDNLAELLSALEALTGHSYSSVRAVTHLSWDTYDEGLAIVSPYAIEDEVVVDLPEGAFPRKVVTGRVSTDVGEVVVATTHLDHRSDEARAVQVEALVRALAELPSADALVLTGDFNEAPGGAVHDSLVDAGLIDLWDALRPDEPGYTFPADDPEVRIDYIWLDPGDAELAPAVVERILVERVGGVTGSDHFGLAGVLRGP